MDEQAYLRTILAHPNDDAPRLVYADWLTERGDIRSLAKARYLRLICDATWQPDSKQEEIERQSELKRLTGAVRTSWLAAVGKMHIEKCQFQSSNLTLPMADGGEVTFSLVCELGWEELTTLEGRPTVRYCDKCSKDVHFCPTTAEAKSRANAGACVAVNRKEQRKTGDLDQTPRLLMGKVLPNRR